MISRPDFEFLHLPLELEPGIVMMTELEECIRMGRSHRIDRSKDGTCWMHHHYRNHDCYFCSNDNHNSYCSYQ